MAPAVTPATTLIDPASLERAEACHDLFVIFHGRPTGRERRPEGGYQPADPLPYLTQAGNTNA